MSIHLLPKPLKLIKRSPLKFPLNLVPPFLNLTARKLVDFVSFAIFLKSKKLEKNAQLIVPMVLKHVLALVLLVKKDV